MFDPAWHGPARSNALGLLLPAPLLHMERLQSRLWSCLSLGEALSVLQRTKLLDFDEGLRLLIEDMP